MAAGAATSRERGAPADRSPLHSDGELTLVSLAAGAGLRRDKLTRKHTGLKDLSYALVEARGHSPGPGTDAPCTSPPTGRKRARRCGGRWSRAARRSAAPTSLSGADLGKRKASIVSSQGVSTANMMLSSPTARSAYSRALGPSIPGVTVASPAKRLGWGRRSAPTAVRGPRLKPGGRRRPTGRCR
ncbi:hypothetical protein DTL70_17230 [Streptomyces diacarni]|uniref:Uncharacterized protein n=1 Tax=Streptomyces diacarni TaxID=2800381 RepID=A0A367EUD4_9ACTN|nr:hypothetical protein DTL70_17230 [Streptomyces diacarni]